MNKAVEILQSIRDEFAIQVSKSGSQNSDVLKIANALVNAIDKEIDSLKAEE